MNKLDIQKAICVMFQNVAYDRDYTIAVATDKTATIDQWHVRNVTKPTAEQMAATLADLAARTKRAAMSLTPLQFELYLVAHNLTAQVDSAINALAEPTKTMAKLARSRAQIVLRNNQFVEMVRAAIGWTSEQMDQAFVDASKITV